MNLFDEVSKEESEEKQKCKYCGRELSTDFEFCIYCGKNLDEKIPEISKSMEIKPVKKDKIIAVKKKQSSDFVLTLLAILFFAVALCFFVAALISNGLMENPVSQAGSAFDIFGSSETTVDLSGLSNVISNYFNTLIFMLAGYILLRIRKK